MELDRAKKAVKEKESTNKIEKRVNCNFIESQSLRLYQKFHSKDEMYTQLSKSTPFWFSDWKHDPGIREESIY